jgi:hypothetical protein
MGEKVSGSQISHSKSKMSFYSFRSCHSSSFSPCSGLLLEARRISHSTKNTIISHHTWWKKSVEIWSHWCVISSLFCTHCLVKMLLRHSSDSYLLLLSQLLILCCYSDSTYEESLSVCWLVSSPRTFWRRSHNYIICALLIYMRHFTGMRVCCHIDWLEFRNIHSLTSVGGVVCKWYAQEFLSLFQVFKVAKFRRRWWRRRSV